MHPNPAAFPLASAAPLAPLPPRYLLLEHLPAASRGPAAELLLSVLAPELGPIFGKGPRGRDILAEGLVGSQVIGAYRGGELLGLLLWETAGSAGLRLPWRAWGQRYGWLLGTARWLRAGLLRHEPAEDELYVEALAVSPRAQGQGVGRQLLDRAAAIARRRQKQFLGLHVIDQRPDSLRFYQRFGFAEVEQHQVGRFRRLTGWRFDRLSYLQVPVLP